jgi:hypothetical protein
MSAQARRLVTRGYRLAAGFAACILATCATWRGVHAFDKQTCAVAYENAQQLRSKLKLRRARDQLLICGHSSCPSVVTRDCNAWLEEIEVELTSVVFRVRDARGQEVTDVRISMDGEHLRDKLDGSSVFVDPGMHVFRFEADGGAVGEVRQMLRKGDRDRPIDLTLKPRGEEPFSKPEQDDLDRADGGLASRLADASGESKPPVELQLTSPSSATRAPGLGTYVAAGVGVVALSSFAYFGLSAQGEAADLRRTCAPSCPTERVDAVRSKLVVANVSLGVGVAAIGVGAALWLMQGSPSPPAASSLRFDVVPAARGKGATLTATLSAP